ncbi:hypothetical protein CJ030_MR0G004689 [Morella rubra]|uniref:Methyltransferase type 11 domain-containing protein n=1 Tax=Morella rubra TaxID=262757 RepID=A0A6A1UMT2_9ROSI|nr:hypothetical protein CJ030_MR0G004689 [Morella rubra]
MITTLPKPPVLKRYFLLSLLLSVPIFLLLFSLQPKRLLATAETPSENSIYGSGDIKIRPGFASYDSYIQRQLNKTLNPKLREIWKTRDWDRKIQVFSRFFQELKQKKLLFNESKALCVGARVGQEVEALRRIGVSDSVGMDLVPCPPLVIDFHNQPFDNDTFEFEFSNVFDHALYPQKFVAEIRPGFASYDSYIQRQLNKTLNPKLREIWKTRDWDRKIQVFSRFFQELKQKKLLFNESKALCVGARVGQEVEALRRIGVSDSVGMDLVPCPPLVIGGDFHNQPFDNDTFEFEFSNVFDHALYPQKFVAEIERTLKPGGVCVLHVALSKRADKYSANDLYSVKPLVQMFKRSEVVHIRKVDGFGLDTEVVFRKQKAIPRS